MRCSSSSWQIDCRNFPTGFPLEDDFPGNLEDNWETGCCVGHSCGDKQRCLAVVRRQFVGTETLLPAPCRPTVGGDCVDSRQERQRVHNEDGSIGREEARKKKNLWSKRKPPCSITGQGGRREEHRKKRNLCVS